MPAALSVILVSFSAIFGACMGSFLNVVAARTVEERPWWGGERSICDSCGRKLTALELVPVVSWFALSGGCKSCGAKIPLRYLIVELGGAAIGGLIAWRWGISLTAAFAAVTMIRGK